MCLSGPAIMLIRFHTASAIERLLLIAKISRVTILIMRYHVNVGIKLIIFDGSLNALILQSQNETQYKNTKLSGECVLRVIRHCT